MGAALPLDAALLHRGAAKFFGGLTIPETAEVLDVSAPTVSRQWRRARLWLYHRLFEDSPLI